MRLLNENKHIEKKEGKLIYVKNQSTFVRLKFRIYTKFQYTGSLRHCRIFKLHYFRGENYFRVYSNSVIEYVSEKHIKLFSP